MNIKFLGDISFNNRYEHLAETENNPFKKLEGLLSSSDYVVGNLECLCRGVNFNFKKKPRLHTSQKSLDFLKNLSVSHVTLAHNHIYDTLIEGYTNTISKLKALEIDSTGATINPKDHYQPFYLEKDGVKIGFLNLVTQDTNPSLPDDCEVLLNYFELEIARQSILKIKEQSDHVVLLLHWGGKHEGSHYPQKDQLDMGKKLIDLGADLIIGHHSHTIQPYQIYKGKHIYFSLGNFCFDDIISDGKMKYLSPRRKRGVILDITFTKNKYNIDRHFVKIRNNEIQLSIWRVKFAAEIRQHVFNTFKKMEWFYSMVYFTNQNVTPIVEFILFDKSGAMNKASRLFRRLFKMNKA